MTALMAGQQLGQYRIVRLLGEGGMGAVYEARQEPLDRRIALKTLHAEYAQDKDAVARFFNEAKVLSRLEHPSIVQVSDFGTAADGTAYLIMEYLRGQSLGRRIRELETRGERLPLVTALQFSFQVADVLAVAHARGIIHRDIKPDNLMLIVDAVAPGGERVKLLDFGIAKLTNESDKGGVKTATQAVIGTPSYMSPEQCAGAGGVDAKTDVYALGCVLYELLAGRPPFVAEGAGQIIGMHLFQAPQPLLSLAPRTPSAIAELVHRFLSKEKAKRPTMTEAADEIGKLLSKQTGGGSVVRSRPVESTNPDAGPLVPSPPLGTTSGRSSGQQISRSPQYKLLRGLTVAAVTIAGATILWRATTNVVAPRPAGTGSPAALPTAATPRTDAPPAEAPPRKDLEKPRMVTWQIDSDPSGCAVLTAEGRSLGFTPFSSSRIAEPGETVLRLHLDGYAETRLTLSGEKDATQHVSLVRTPVPVQKPSKGTAIPSRAVTPPPPSSQDQNNPYEVPVIR